MRIYIMITGAVFGLITIAHIVRIIVEGSHVATNPFYIILTLVTAGLTFWAWRLLRLSARS